MNAPIPKFPFRLLRFFCPDDLLEEIEGDLLQWYKREAGIVGVQRAKRRMLWHVIRFCRPEILWRHKVRWHNNPFHMVPHFLKIFLRTSLKSASYSLINISGLAVGMACSIFALLWILDETSYDQFHEKKEQIFTIRTNLTSGDGINTFPNTPGRLAEELKNFPEVEQSCRTAVNGSVLFTQQHQSFYEEGLYADASLFNIFTFQYAEGDPSHSLPDANSVVITEQLATKYFGQASALGKTFRINNKYDVRVTGVIRNLPTQSTLQFHFILPYVHYANEDQYNQEWGAWTGGNTYLQLRANSEVEALNRKIAKDITHAKIWPRWGNNVELFLFPLSDWHLKRFENGKLTDGVSKYIRIVAIIAGLILIIACVNFMNLATARSMSRAKEIGVRKVVGAARTSLTQQFIGESVLLSFISLAAALVVVHVSLPQFNVLTNKQIVMDYSNPMIWLSMVSIAILTGLLAGCYPALFLSSLRAIHVLKGTLPQVTGAGIRKTLVVFQFSISVILVIGAMVIYRQIDYMRNKDLGFDKENIFYLNASPALIKNYSTFRQQVTQHPGVQSIARASEEPMNIGTGLDMSDDAWRGKTKEDNAIFKWLFCDEDFLTAFRLPIKTGRNFSARVAADTSNFIVSEEAARRMHFAEPIGETLKIDRTGSIIGVVNDFHSTGLTQPIQPVIISLRPERASRIFIRYEKGQLSDVLDWVQSQYKKLDSTFPMEYFFLDDAFNRVYQNEIQTSRITTAFMVIALFISCLGLFGLSSFTAERRVKEIGIRKVLGATRAQLVFLLCREFVQLIILSLLVAFPFAWWTGNRFLETYAFRIELGPFTFLLAAMWLICLALGTVAWQSMRAAGTDPAKNLRSE